MKREICRKFNPGRLFFILPVIFWLVSPAHAVTAEELMALEKEKQTTPVVTPPPEPAAPKKIVRPYQIPGGTTVNAADYRIVLFMQSGCHYCQQFDPMLVQLSAMTGFKVFPYTLDGRGDVSFPEAIPAPATVVSQFFGAGQQAVTPATWLVNVNTMQTWPLAVGIVDGSTLLERVHLALRTVGPATR